MAKGKLAAVATLAGGVLAFKAYNRVRAPKPLKTHYTPTPRRKS